jgi:hypothetical protein
MTEEANAQAWQLFERAISLDSQYAAAYAALSDSHMMNWLNWAPHQSLEQIFALTPRAVELDDSLPLAHSALGYAYMRMRQHMTRPSPTRR